MRLTIRKGLGLLGAGLVALPLAVALAAAYPTPMANSAEAQSCVQQERDGEVDDAQEAGTKQQDGDREGASPAQSRSASADNGDRDRVVQLEAIPEIDRLVAAPSRSGVKSEQNAKTDADDPRLPPEIPKSRLRNTSVFPARGNSLLVRSLPETPDGRRTYILQGRVDIVSESPTFGMIDVEADEITITRGRSEEKHRQAGHGATWVDDDKLPMEMLFKGNVVLRHDRDGVGRVGERRIIHAAKLDYDFVTDELEAVDAVIVAVGADGSSSFEAPRIKLWGFLTQERDRSGPGR